MNLMSRRRCVKMFQPETFRRVQDGSEVFSLKSFQWQVTIFRRTGAFEMFEDDAGVPSSFTKPKNF